MAEKRTYQQRREAHIKAVIKRRKKVKALALEYKGGKCQSCGYNRCEAALELHHLDPKTKSFGIGEKGYTRSWLKVKAELDKCILLCANCHREIEAGILQLSGESQIEKRGELLETQVEITSGNQQPSPESLAQRKGSETILNWSSSPLKAHEAPRS